MDQKDWIISGSIHLKIMVRTKILFLLLFCSIALGLSGQGFIKQYVRAESSSGNDVEQTADGGFLIVGYISQPVGALPDILLIRTDANGDTLWTKVTGNPAKSLVIYDMDATPDGGYVLSGYQKNSISGDDMFWMKIDSLGNTLWEKNLGMNNNTWAWDVEVTSDHSILMAGKNTSGNGALLVKCDSLGDTLWTRALGTGGNNWAYGVLEASDGSYLVTGDYNTTGFLYKYSASGSLQWTFTGPANGRGQDVVELPGGNFVMGSSYPCRLDLISPTGTWLAGQQMANQYELEDLVLTADGRLALGGKAYSMVLDPDTFALIIADTNFNILVNKRYRLRTSTTFSESQEMGLITTQQNGFALTHLTGPNTFGVPHYDPILIVTDSLGNAYTNMISGNVYGDADGNCSFGTGDFPQRNVVLELDGGIFYATTDTNGYYELECTPGPHVVKIFNTHPYLTELCPTGDTLQVNFATTGDTLQNQDFAFTFTDSCPLLTVDLAAGLFRPGIATTLTAEYCNIGFTDATNVRLEIVLDTFFTVTSTVPAPNSVSGTTYEFIFPVVPAGACGTITFNTLVDTNATIGSTLCHEAHIYPDTSCGPVDTTWDRSSVQVNGYCDDSLACFTVTNTGDPGNGDMDGPTPWRLYINGILVQSGTVQINGGQDTVLCFPANGNTIRLEVDQRPGHPGNSRPNDVVELCGSGVTPPVTGMVTALPQDNADPFVDVFCRQVVNSFDPNVKYVFPSGVDAPHFIPHENESFYYEIHFQNTGTAEAINVYIRDTLPAELEIGSLRLIGSSHPVTDFQLFPNGVLQWRFININLPDSTTNKPASHGYVSFRIRHKGNFPNWTRIENRAGIYFDFNEPVITDYAFVTLHDTIAAVFVDPAVPEVEAQLLAWPNPGRGQFHFRIEGETVFSENLTLEVFEISGRKVLEKAWNRLEDLQIDLTAQPDGLFIYRLRRGNVPLTSGKLIKRN